MTSGRQVHVVFATVDEVCERIPEASRRSVVQVLAALGAAICYAAGGEPDDALVALNGPLIAFEPPQELLAWFAPILANDALIALAKGDRVPLEVMLDMFGLSEHTGETFARTRAALAELDETFGSAVDD